MTEASALAAPLAIGPVRLRGRLALAPMAGYSNLAYRVLARRYGAALTTTEMVSAKALAHGNEKTRRLLDRDDREVPVSAQVFGADAADLAEASRIVAGLGFHLVDVNMGCPVPKITGGGGGCALMTDPARTARMIETMVRASPIPVTVKIRAGWDDASRNAPEVARALESAGAAALTVHGRTRTQLYSGRADRRLIGDVKREVGIPVFGNGDVDSPHEALDMLEQSGADGIAIGRGALGRPWIFGQIEAVLRGETPPADPTLPEVGRIVLELMEGVIALYGEALALRMLRKLVADFSRGVPGGARFRDGAVRVTSRDELVALVRAHLRYEGEVPPSPVAAPVDGPLPPPEPGGG
ncbi:MAG TPA: tRNA dihydrouridine synthase DusB [Planctomycetota bacterium]|nr:tRNA dihydrouridine synthase DusB [Planctomycetota bacterium]